MKCVDPKRIQMSGPIKKRKIEKYVPCGKCAFCVERKRQDWVFRLQNELKVAKSAFFITLTYEEENLVYYDKGKHYPSTHMVSDFSEPTISKRHAQLFIKKARREIQYFLSNEAKLSKVNKWYAQAYKHRQIYSKWPPLRFYLIGEYGGMFGRPHYHVLLFNFPNDLVPKLSKIWAKGFVHIGQVTTKSIRYCTEYMLSRITHNLENEAPFALMSLGIGKNYRHKKENGLIARQNGIKFALPRYYTDKVFNKWELLYHKTNARKEQDIVHNKQMSDLTRKTKNPYKAHIEGIEAKRQQLIKKHTKKSIK